MKMKKEQEPILGFKSFLKRILPPPTNSFNREIQRVLNTIEGNKHIDDNYLTEINQLKQKLDEYSRRVDELTWANVFNSTIAGSKWLINASFSPGRAAVGYPFLYVMYRVLNDIQPNSILELGLGQSTKMIGQYAAFKEINHYVVEHDPSWVNFFKNGFTLSEYTQIVLLKTKMEHYKNAEAVRVYEDFERTFKEKKFNFICIDAPFGYDMPLYSRIDVLKLLPDCLEKSFIIIIDDYQRIGEKNTVCEIKNILDSCNVKYSTGVYSGDKDLCLICSSDLAFLCTL